MSNKWIRVDKSHEGGPRIFRAVRVPFHRRIAVVSLSGLQSHFSKLCVCVASQVESIQDHVREKLLLVRKGDSAPLEEKEKNELKKRKLLSEM